MADQAPISDDAANADVASPVLTIQARITAMMAHVLALCTSFIGPLVVFVSRRQRSEFIAFHALQSVYFQIVVLLALVVSVLLTHLLSLFQGLIPLVLIADVVYVVWMGLNALDGGTDEYLILGAIARKHLER